MVHNMLAALFDKKNPPKANVKFANNNGVLSYTMTLSHTKNLLAEGVKARDKA
jgi:hypothetical protein